MATKREYLFSIGLAKMGRGKFSAVALEALAEATAKGIVFDDPVKPEVKAKTVVIGKHVSTPPVVKVNLPETDPKAVRSWAKQNGHQVGERGRIHTSVVSAYLAAGGKATVPTARKIPTPVDMPKRVRPQNEGWTFWKRGKDDGKHLSEPLLCVTSCGKCRKGVSYCDCSTGPIAPVYAGGQNLLMVKPSV